MAKPPPAGKPPRRLRARLRDAVSAFGWGGAYASGVGSAHNPASAFYGHMNTGGIVNPISGMGLGADKGDSSFFLPTRIVSRQELEVIYVESWAARRFIDVPVDDMLIRWREFDEDSEGDIDRVIELEESLGFRDCLARAMKAGRLHGTGMLYLNCMDASPEMPLMPERVMEGDLISLVVLDRWDATVLMREDDPLMPGFGEPILYRIQTRRGYAFNAHASRLLRFDGATPISSTGWQTYDEDWGVSELVPVIRTITQDGSLVAAITHLSQEASIPVIRTEGMRDAIVGNLGKDEAGTEQIGQRINYLKSIFRMMFLDKTDEFMRVETSFASLPDLMDRFQARLAAAAGIPATRFLGRSPIGMNATGDSDMQNYAIMVEALRERTLQPVLNRVDLVIARSAGLAEMPEYNWPSLIDLSDQDKAIVAKTWAENLAALLAANVLDENEAREVLRKIDPRYGDLMPMDEDLLERNQPDAFELQPGGPPAGETMPEGAAKKDE